MTHPVMFTAGVWLLNSIVFLGLADIAVASREMTGAKRSKVAEIATAVMIVAFSLIVALLIGFSI